MPFNQCVVRPDCGATLGNVPRYDLERLQPDRESALSAWAALSLSLSEHFIGPQAAG